MATRNPSPPYFMKLKGRWRVIIPRFGKLTPFIVKDEFISECAARDWLIKNSGIVSEIDR